MESSVCCGNASLGQVYLPQPGYACCGQVYSAADTSLCCHSDTGHTKVSWVWLHLLLSSGVFCCWHLPVLSQWYRTHKGEFGLATPALVRCILPLIPLCVVTVTQGTPRWVESGYTCCGQVCSAADTSLCCHSDTGHTKVSLVWLHLLLSSGVFCCWHFIVLSHWHRIHQGELSLATHAVVRCILLLTPHCVVTVTEGTKSEFVHPVVVTCWSEVYSAADLYSSASGTKHELNFRCLEGRVKAWLQLLHYLSFSLFCFFISASATVMSQCCIYQFHVYSL